MDSVKIKLYPIYPKRMLYVFTVSRASDFRLFIYGNSCRVNKTPLKIDLGFFYILVLMDYWVPAEGYTVKPM